MLDFDKIVNSSLKTVMEGEETQVEETQETGSSTETYQEGEEQVMSDLDRACYFAEASAISAGLGALNLLRQLRMIEESGTAKKIGTKAGLAAAAGAAGAAAYPAMKKGAAMAKDDIVKGAKAAKEGVGEGIKKVGKWFAKDAVTNT